MKDCVFIEHYASLVHPEKIVQLEEFRRNLEVCLPLEEILRGKISLKKEREVGGKADSFLQYLDSPLEYRIPCLNQIFQWVSSVRSENQGSIQECSIGC